MTPELAVECGFTPVFLKGSFTDHFFHGKPLSEKLFKEFPSDRADQSVPLDQSRCTEYAVFVGTAAKCEAAAERVSVKSKAAETGTAADRDPTKTAAERESSAQNCSFVGIVERKGRFLKYGFVINDAYKTL